MGMVEDIAEAHAALGAPNCKVCKMLDRLPDLNEKAEARAAVEGYEEGKIDHVTLARIFTKNGYPMSEATVRRHRAERH